MRYLLNCGYLIALFLLSPWLLVAALRKGKYREGWREKFWGSVPRRSGDRPCVWLHAVSVGEVNLLPTLIEEIERRHPGWECVVSTTTATGYRLARRRFSTRSVFYCPLDFSWAVERSMRRIRPRLLVLAELELWPNLIGTAKRHGVSVAVINGRLGDSSAAGYRRVARWMAPVFRSLDLICAQNEEYAERFRMLGASADRVRITGSLKFDGAETDRENERTRRLREEAGIDADDLILLAGSTQAPEESLVLDTYRELSERFPKLRLIVVPRHPERFDEVARLLDRSGCCWARRGALDEARDPERWRVLLVDVVGELGAWWGTADVGFVGGSLGDRGGQNMIEPAAYGVAVCFGPNTFNFRDVVRLLRSATVVVRTGEQLTRFVAACLEDPRYRRSLGGQARRLVLRQAGATRRTVDLLEPYLSDVPIAGDGEDRPLARCG